MSDEPTPDATERVPTDDEVNGPDAATDPGVIDEPDDLEDASDADDDE